jgi:hypothetical protein
MASLTNTWAGYISLLAFVGAYALVILACHIRRKNSFKKIEAGSSNWLFHVVHYRGL